MASTTIFTRYCPICEEPFQLKEDPKRPGFLPRGRPAIYCSAECKKEARSLDPTALPRICHVCRTHFTVDNSQSGTASSYCSLECQDQFELLLRRDKSKRRTCAARLCTETITEPRQHFCSEPHLRQWMADNNVDLCWNCNTEPRIVDVENLRKPQKFCSQECRDEYYGHAAVKRALAADRESALDQRRKRARQVKRAQADPEAPIFHSIGHLCMADSAKKRWTEYPARMLAELLACGWRSEEEFFLTDGICPPAVTEMLMGSNADRPPITTKHLKVRRFGEEPTPYPPEDGPAANSEELIQRAKDIQAEMADAPRMQDYLVTWRRRVDGR
jgi:hypothetical protein